MRICLTGKNGQLGWELSRALSVLGEVHAMGRQELDLSDLGSIREVVRRLRPQLIVNAAAYTEVDRAEEEPALAHRINAEAVGVLGEEARAIGAAVVHYSTDYVFDGAKLQPYREEDAPAPLSVYGASKLAGEQALASSGAAHYVFRSSWIFGARGENFLRKILRRAYEQEQLTVVDDQYGSPTWSRMIAEATLMALARTPTTGEIGEAKGIYHLTAAGVTNWHQFAEAVLLEYRERSRSRRSLRARLVRAISSSQLSARARRPAHSVLSNEKLRRRFGIVLPDWRLQLRSVVAELPECCDQIAGEESRVATQDD